MAEINTERLIMRGWRESDLEPWAAMNADPEVRQFLGPVLTFEQSLAWVLNFQDDLDRNGFGFWAVEVRESCQLIGFRGCKWWTTRARSRASRQAGGWRERPWGHGYATEAALAAAGLRIRHHGPQEILAGTMAANKRSQAVMRRIGMTSDPADDFDDPDVDEVPLR
jgi:RimJ/RimL family protein N-acetyltransferase